MKKSKAKSSQKRNTTHIPPLKDFPRSSNIISQPKTYLQLWKWTTLKSSQVSTATESPASLNRKYPINRKHHWLASRTKIIQILAQGQFRKKSHIEVETIIKRSTCQESLQVSPSFFEFDIFNKMNSFHLFFVILSFVWCFLFKVLIG